MIKKQVSWQAEKFSFSADMSKNQVYQGLRQDIKNMQANGWEVISQEVAGYDQGNGDVIIVLGLAKYEYIPEPAPEPSPVASPEGTVKLKAEDVAEEKETPRRGRPAKKDK